MANVTITQLPVAGPIVGTELVPIVQDGQTVQTTTAAIAASPAQFQTFLTLNQEPTLPNSRRLTAGTGLGLADGGPLSTLSLSLNGASGSLETALTGIVAKTGGVTVVARTLTASGLGLGITDGSGVAGNPTFSLTGQVADLANLSSPGLVASSGSALNPRVILGTAGEIDVADGNGAAGNPTVGLADDPIIPGTGGMRLPTGTTAQRNPNTNGYLRYNSDLNVFEGYANGSWQTAVVGGVTFVDANGGLTGLNITGGPITTSGTFSLSGTLNVGSGGTGLVSYGTGDILYASGTATLSGLSIGAASQILTSSGTAPQWTDGSTIAVGTATNLAGGSTGAVPYQTGGSATSFLALGAAGQVLVAGASAPKWDTVNGGTF
jgi:hypothetical protein